MAGVRIKVKRNNVNSIVGPLSAGYEYTVPDYEAERLRLLGELDEGDAAAEVSPAERAKDLARSSVRPPAGARVDRMARGATVTR